MRTVLTGAAGYVGLHLLRELLEDGQEVTALVRAPERLGVLARAPGLRWWWPIWRMKPASRRRFRGTTRSSTPR